MNLRPHCKKLVHSRSVEGTAGSMRRGFTLLFYGACQLDSGEPGELVSDRVKASFRQNSARNNSQQIQSQQAVFGWDGDPSILRSFRLSCWFEPSPHVIDSIMREQEAYPN
jgi:hypothetical protein